MKQKTKNETKDNGGIEECSSVQERESSKNKGEREIELEREKGETNDRLT